METASYVNFLWGVYARELGRYEAKTRLMFNGFKPEIVNSDSRTKYEEYFAESFLQTVKCDDLFSSKLLYLHPLGSKILISKDLLEELHILYNKKIKLKQEGSLTETNTFRRPLFRSDKFLSSFSMDQNEDEVVVNPYSCDPLGLLEEWCSSTPYENVLPDPNKEEEVVVIPYSCDSLEFLGENCSTTPSANELPQEKKRHTKKEEYLMALGELVLGLRKEEDRYTSLTGYRKTNVKNKNRNYRRKKYLKRQ